MSLLETNLKNARPRPHHFETKAETIKTKTKTVKTEYKVETETRPSETEITKIGLKTGLKTFITDTYWCYEAAIIKTKNKSMGIVLKQWYLLNFSYFSINQGCAICRLGKTVV